MTKTGDVAVVIAVAVAVYVVGTATVALVPAAVNLVTVFVATAFIVA